MKWVLIFVVVTQAQTFGSFSVVQEFDDLPACEVELERLRDFHRYVVSQEPHSAYLLARCAPKSLEEPR